MAEHLLEGGEAVAKWLLRIFNAIVNLEANPYSLKCGVIILVNKGNERDNKLQGYNTFFRHI